MLQSPIKRMPLMLQKGLLKLLYLRNGKHLQDLKVLSGGKFYLYKVQGVYVPSETLGWFIDYPYYQQWVSAISAFAYKPQDGDVVIDIGAGMGEETLVFSKLIGQTGKVYAIEANPEVFNVLKEVVSLNGLNNIELVNIAVASKNGPVEITIDEESFLGGTIGQRTGDMKSFKVTGRRFDTFVEEHSIKKIDLLKTNIEGAERFVIETIGDALPLIKNVAISCHDFRSDSNVNPFFKTKALVREFLLDNGFDIFSQKTGNSHIDDWIYGKSRKAVN